eukprot:23748-Amphidinium_carterae.1
MHWDRPSHCAACGALASFLGQVTTLSLLFVGTLVIASFGLGCRGGLTHPQVLFFHLTYPPARKQAKESSMHFLTLRARL